MNVSANFLKSLPRLPGKGEMLLVMRQIPNGATPWGIQKMEPDRSYTRKFKRSEKDPRRDGPLDTRTMHDIYSEKAKNPSSNVNACLTAKECAAIIKASPKDEDEDEDEIPEKDKEKDE